MMIDGCEPKNDAAFGRLIRFADVLSLIHESAWPADPIRWRGHPPTLITHTEWAPLRAERSFRGVDKLMRGRKGSEGNTLKTPRL